MIPFIKRFSYLHLKNLDDLQPDETEVKGIVPSSRYNLRARAGWDGSNTLLACILHAGCRLKLKRYPHIAKYDLVLQRVLYPGSVIVLAWTPRFRLVIDRKNKQPKEAIQIDGQRKTLEHCVARVVTRYPVGIWLMANAECMG
ncbi:hypothetical protein TNCV_4028651 [Trichonephila clavipes]|nr:hypothetical protein TNCV_4028651 [Trichonephila clavipes]